MILACSLIVFSPASCLAFLKGDEIGKMIDERPTDCLRPTVKDLTEKCTCQELKEFWVTALEAQIEELKEQLDQGTDASHDLLKCLEKELANARKFDADKAEAKTQKAAGSKRKR